MSSTILIIAAEHHHLSSRSLKQHHTDQQKLYQSIIYHGRRTSKSQISQEHQSSRAVVNVDWNTTHTFKKIQGYHAEGDYIFVGVKVNPRCQSIDFRNCSVRFVVSRQSSFLGHHCKEVSIFMFMNDELFDAINQKKIKDSSLS